MSNTSELELIFGNRMKELSEILSVGDHKLYLTGYKRAGTVSEDMAVLSLMSDNPVLIENKHHKWIRIDDDARDDIRAIFESCHDFIDEHLKSRSVVVHCAAGISRSATIVISYIMKTLQRSYFEAHKYVEAKRSIIKPNPGFVTQLIAYDAYLTAPES